MSKATAIAKVIRKRLAAQVNPSGARVGIALSGGADSCSVLAAMLEQDVAPVVLSYTPDTHESTDFKMARQTAETCGLQFVAVRVEMSGENLEGCARLLTGQGFSTKLEVESLTPMLHVVEAAQRVGVGRLYTGDQSDGYFINNNWMARNYDRSQGIPGYLRKPVKEDPDATRIDVLRNIYWNEDRSCSGAIATLGKQHGVEVVVPYRDPAIFKAFVGSHWRDVNEPRLKEPIRLAYENSWAMYGIGVRDQVVNLHRGDSLFAETMGKVLMERLPGPWRSVTGLYSAMARGEV